MAVGYFTVAAVALCNYSADRRIGKGESTVRRIVENGAAISPPFRCGPERNIRN